MLHPLTPEVGGLLHILPETSRQSRFHGVVHWATTLGHETEFALHNSSEGGYFILEKKDRVEVLVSPIRSRVRLMTGVVLFLGVSLRPCHGHCGGGERRLDS